MKKPIVVLRSVRIALAIIVIIFLTQALLPVSISAAPLPQQEGQPVTISLADWGYEDVTLVGPFDNVSYSLGLPSHWEVQPGSTLNLSLDFSVSKSMATELSELVPLEDYAPVVRLQVVLNGQPVYTVDDVVVGQSNIVVPLPDFWPESEGDVDRLQVILSIHGRCEFYAVSSLVVRSDTHMTFTYREQELPLDLASYPQPFFQRSFLPDNLTIVIPEKPTATELETAFSIAAGLGSLTGNQVALNPITDAEFAALAGNTQPANPRLENVILVGTPASNTVIGELIKSDQTRVKAIQRSLSLAVSGPDLVIPGQPAAFTIDVKNTTAAAASGLGLNARLPVLASDVRCSAACKAANGLVSWQPEPLAAGGTASFQVSYTLPQDAPLQVVNLAAELLQGTQPLNVSSISSPVAAEGTAEMEQSNPESTLFFTYNGSAVAETDGVLQLIPSPWQAGKAVLLVTGLSDAALVKAGRALTLPARFPGMAGTVALIQDVQPGSTAARDARSSFTFAELGYTDETFVGIGQKSIFYPFFIPFNWLLTEDASIELEFSHSLLLDPEQSSISLFLNDKPLATAALDESNAIDGKLTAQLSARDTRPGLNNILLVQIEAELPDPCVFPESSQSWVSISADSTVNLNHNEVDASGLKDLDYWPQMFITEPALNDVLLALPQQPSQAEWKLASQLASFLGAASGSSDAQMKILLGDPGDTDLSAYNILIIGRSTRSELLQGVNDQLPQPFIPETDSILQKVDGVIYRLPDGLELGYLQLIPSPWNPNNTVLALTGTSDAAMEQAGQYLMSIDLMWQLEGNLAMARGGEVFTTDTRMQTSSGVAQFTATLVPEATQAAAVTIATPQPTVVAASDVTKMAAPQTYPQRYPYLLPLVLGVGLLLILGLLAVVFLKRKHSI